VNDDLGIRACLENVTMPCQFGLQFFVIINLAVEYNPNRFPGVGHWLMAASQVNNRKPPESEAKRAIVKITAVIRTSMKHRPGHPLNGFRVNGLVPV
jgi:hypothetical protein